MSSDEHPNAHRAEDPLEEIASILALGIKRRRTRLRERLNSASPSPDTKLH